MEGWREGRSCMPARGIRLAAPHLPTLHNPHSPAPPLRWGSVCRVTLRWPGAQLPESACLAGALPQQPAGSCVLWLVAGSRLNWAGAYSAVRAPPPPRSPPPRQPRPPSPSPMPTPPPLSVGAQLAVSLSAVPGGGAGSKEEAAKTAQALGALLAEVS